MFRLPTAAAIKSMLAAGEVPEDKIKESIATALTRMRFEKKGALLKTKDPIPDIIKRLFPAPGVFDEAEFAKVVDVADRNKIYERAVDAEAKLTAGDKAKLNDVDGPGRPDARRRDRRRPTTSSGCSARRPTQAKANYGKAKTAMATLKGKIDTNVHTDYNHDDEQTRPRRLGEVRRPDGAPRRPTWRRARTRSSPRSRSCTSACTSPTARSRTTAATTRRAPPRARAGRRWTDDEKLNNAAHYEEIPRRHVGKSVFKDDQKFKPGISRSTGARDDLRDGGPAGRQPVPAQGVGRRRRHAPRDCAGSASTSRRAAPRASTPRRR